jgi:hypothetical protein
MGRLDATGVQVPRTRSANTSAQAMSALFHTLAFLFSTLVANEPLLPQASEASAPRVASTSRDALSSPTLSAPRPVIVVLHGRGLPGVDSMAFRLDVLRWMRENARAVTGSSLLRDDDVRLVWYADLVSSSMTASHCALPPEQAADSTLAPLAALAAFAGSLFDVAEVDSSSGSRELRSIVRDMRYFSDPALRCAADRRVGNALAAAAAEGRPVVLVAYSFGGLLAWNHLTTRTTTAKSPQITQFVTIGSPVASQFVRQLVFADNRPVAALPPKVGSWVNIVDTADPFAAAIAPDSTTRGSSAMRDVVISPGRTNPHDLRGYLEQRATIDAVIGGWCAASVSPEAPCKAFSAGR